MTEMTREDLETITRQMERDALTERDKPSRWARVEIAHTATPQPVLNLHVGSRKPDGQHEIALGFYSYWRERDGTVRRQWSGGA